MGPSKVLVIGATGYLGNFMTMASVAAGHSTFALIRGSTLSDPAKSASIVGLKAVGVKVVEGSFEDHQSLVNALKQVDVVISTTSGSGFHQQFALIPAIKEAGTIKRFVPSEFGLDLDRVALPAPLEKVLGLKRKLRRDIEAAGIPYTIVNNCAFFRNFLACMWQMGATSPPKDKVIIYGDGEKKVSFVEENDIAVYTIKAIDDPRALNKVLSVRPQLLSPNEVLAIWEKKIGHTIEKTYVSVEDVKKQIADSVSAPIPTPPNPPLVAVLCIRYSIFVDGAMSVEAGPNYAEVHDLYPDYKFVDVEGYLSKFV